MPRKSTCKFCKKEFVKENKLNPYCRPMCQIQADAQRKREKAEKERVKKEKDRKKKSESITKLKEKLWKIVSEYVRLRDSDDDNYCVCCTCWERRHYKDSMQGGHYIASGQSSFHRYNEKNIHAQCYWCNVGKNGNVLEYREFMIRKYGQEYTDWLFETRNEVHNLGKVELMDYIEQYQVKLNEVKQRKAID